MHAFKVGQCVERENWKLSKSVINRNTAKCKWSKSYWNIKIYLAEEWKPGKSDNI